VVNFGLAYGWYFDVEVGEKGLLEGLERIAMACEQGLRRTVRLLALPSLQRL
jgi:hypothetical protein